MNGRSARASGIRRARSCAVRSHAASLRAWCRATRPSVYSVGSRDAQAAGTAASISKTLRRIIVAFHPLFADCLAGISPARKRGQSTSCCRRSVASAGSCRRMRPCRPACDTRRRCRAALQDRARDPPAALPAASRSRDACHRSGRYGRRRRVSRPPPACVFPSASDGVTMPRWL